MPKIAMLLFEKGVDFTLKYESWRACFLAALLSYPK